VEGVARAARYQEPYTLDRCVEDLEEQLPEDQRADAESVLTPLCQSVLANLPESLPGTYTPSYFTACVANSGGLGRVLDGGPIRDAALAHCLGGLRSGEIQDCNNSAMSIASDEDQAADLCTLVYQSRPLGVPAGSVMGCATARLLVNGANIDAEDIPKAFENCNTDLAKESLAHQGDGSTSLPGAEDCLRLIGAGSSATDTAEARCAYILQARPAGIDVAALAACISGNADFDEAYRRCAESLAAPSATATAAPTAVPPTLPPATPAVPVTPLGITTGQGSYRIGDTLRYCYTVPAPGFIRVTLTLSPGGGRQLLAGNDDGRGDCRAEQIDAPSSGAQPASGCVVIEYVGSATLTAQACFAITAAVCRQWDVTGTWATAHGDNKYHPSFTFQQSGTAITGTASLSGAEQTLAGYTSPAGSVTGTMRGDQLDVIVTWSGRNGAVQGHYFGTVTQGRVTGSAAAVGASTGIGWTGTGPTRCVSTS
jgi:hypothetical protein